MLSGLAVFLAFAALVVLQGILQTKHVMKSAARQVDGNVTWLHTYPGFVNYVYVTACFVLFLLSSLLVIVTMGAAIQEFQENHIVNDIVMKISVVVTFSFMIYCSIKLMLINCLYYIRFSDSQLSFNRFLSPALVLWSDIDHIELEGSGLSRILLKNGVVVKFAHGYAGMTQFYDMALLKGIAIRKSWA